MASIWVESIGLSFEQAFDLLAAAVGACSDQLWGTSMWDVPAPDADHQFLDADWNAITDPEQRRVLVQRWVERRSTPWSVAWHALECLDYDLNGEFGPWAPPPPFTGHPHWCDLATLPAAWSQSEILGYNNYCREQVRDTLAGMTEETAATPLPPSHRYGGQPYAHVISGMVGHTIEHASQIRQFITGAGIAPTNPR